AAECHRWFCCFLFQRVQTRATSAGKDHCHDFFCHNFILPFCFCAPVGQGRKSTCWNPGGLPPGVRPALFFRGLFRLGLAAPLGVGVIFWCLGCFLLGHIEGCVFVDTTFCR